jgi:hypothetical protein
VFAVPVDVLFEDLTGAGCVAYVRLFVAGARWCVAPALTPYHPSQTALAGGGKTLAYALPVVSLVDVYQATLQAIVVVPTKELSVQVRIACVSVIIISICSGAQLRRCTRCESPLTPLAL